MIRGFTLLELMIVVAIAAILLTVAIPGMQSLTASMSVDSQLNRVMRDVMFARNQAVNLGSTVRICTLDSDDKCDGIDNSGYVIFIDVNNDNAFATDTDTDDAILSSFDAFKTGSVVNLGARNSIRFSSEGLSTGTNATLTYCTQENSEYAGTVSISQLGSVSSVELSSSDALTACASE